MAPRLTCACGECRKCRHREYMRAYYRKPGVAERIRASARASRNRRIEAAREYDRKRGFRVYDIAKVRARAEAQSIPSQPCEVCGAFPADKHHDDYSRPRDVRFLCEYHHGIVHRKVA